MTWPCAKCFTNITVFSGHNEFRHHNKHCPHSTEKETQGQLVQPVSRNQEVNPDPTCGHRPQWPLSQSVPHMPAPFSPLEPKDTSYQVLAAQAWPLRQPQLSPGSPPWVVGSLKATGRPWLHRTHSCPKHPAPIFPSHRLLPPANLLNSWKLGRVVEKGKEGPDS